MYPSAPCVYGFANFNSLDAKTSNKCAYVWCFLNVRCVSVCVCVWYSAMNILVFPLSFFVYLCVVRVIRGSVVAKAVLGE